MRGVSIDYIWEKAMDAVKCLCSGSGSFEQRFYNAYIEALIRLRPGRPPKFFADDLNWILELCDRHVVVAEEKVNQISETDQRKLVEKLIHLVIQSSRMIARRDERLRFGEAQLRRLCTERGMDWDRLAGDEREEFVNQLLHEE